MSLEEVYNNLEIPTKTYELLPQGKYRAEITRCSVNEETQKLEWEYTVKFGEHSGRKVWQNQSLTGEYGWMVKSTFKTLGLNGDTFKLLTENAPKALGLMVEITVKHNKSKTSDKIYVNGYIERLLTQDEMLEFDKDEKLPF